MAAKRKSEFRVGDRVMVESLHFTEQNGLTGIVAEINHNNSLPFMVEYDAGQRLHKYFIGGGYGEYNTYRASDLRLIAHPVSEMEDTRSYLDAITR